MTSTNVSALFPNSAPLALSTKVAASDPKSTSVVFKM